MTEETLRELRIGEKLKYYREQNKFSLREVEEITGVSNAYLSQLENGKIINPSIGILIPLVILYKINLNLFLGIQPANHETMTQDEKDEIMKFLSFRFIRKDI